MKSLTSSPLDNATNYLLFFGVAYHLIFAGMA